MHINPYSIPPTLCSMLALFLGIFVLCKNFKSPINRVFFLQCNTIVLWLSSYSVLYNFNISHPWVGNYFRISYCGVTFIAITFFHYLMEFLDLQWAKLWNKINYSLGVVASFFILMTDFIVQGLYQYYWGPYPQAGPWHPLYLIYFITLCIAGVGLVTIQIQRGQLTGKRKNQAKYILPAFGIYTLACFDFVPNYGIELYPFGYIPTTVFLFIIAYAIGKHQLMDINIVFRKALIYSFLVAIITVVYLIMVLFIEGVFKNLIGYKSFLTSLFAASFIAIIFIPLKNQIQRVVDRLFFKGTPIEIAEQNELLRHEVAQTERLKAVSTLATGMAHEIRNPLTAIKTFSEYLPKKLEDKDFLQKFSRIADHEVDRIDHLIRQLLEFSKPAPLTLQETDINQLIEDTLNFLNSIFVKHRTQIVKDFYIPDHIRLKADPNQLKQALLNIFLNAIDAMPKGETLIITTKAKYGLRTKVPAMSAAAPAPNTLTPASLEITVEDTGHGIASKDLSHILTLSSPRKMAGQAWDCRLRMGLSRNIKGRSGRKARLGKERGF